MRKDFFDSIDPEPTFAHLAARIFAGAPTSKLAASEPEEREPAGRGIPPDRPSAWLPTRAEDDPFDQPQIVLDCASIFQAGRRI
jgi:hypothetical protein